ncbi:MAG: hypothetical protein HUJ76_13085, partial [Parasporobacterium sp.]|nr:hypothetical protein [Parasporobacterium sp.]
MGNSYGLANPWRTGDSAVNGDGQALVMNFLNNVQGKDPVKGNLHLASFYTQSGSTYQDVAYGSFEPVVTEGYLKIHKQSTCTAVSKGNSHYDLSGAWYGVYKNASCTSADMVTSLKTDANGDTATVKLQAGTYYVKEGTAPKGFKIDTQVYKVEVTTGHTANNPVVINSNDVPYNDPINVAVSKINAETGDASEKLEGAEYTFIYYDLDGVTKVEDINGKEPFYKDPWVLKTNNKGMVYFSEKYKISGSALPVVGTDPYTGNIYGLPLGTLTVQETKAPEGYELDPTVYVFSIRMNSAGTAAEMYCHTTNTKSGIIAGNVGDEGVTHKEKPIRANLKFVKVDEKGSPLAGIPFEIESLTTGEKHTVTSDENGVVEVIPETA